MCFISVVMRNNSEANMTEWSKVLRSGRSVFARVGSNPTVCIFPFSFFIMSESLLNKQEVLYYDAVFASLTEGKEDVIHGKEAVSILRQSELSSDEIKSVCACISSEL